jgi:transposase-like protein
LSARIGRKGGRDVEEAVPTRGDHRQAALREADVLLSQGAKVADVVKAIEIHEVTYYRWRKEYGGLKVTQVKRLRELEKENSRLRKAVSDLTLDKMILQEAARGNF